MRVAVSLLTILCMGALTEALAEPQSSPSATEPPAPSQPAPTPPDIQQGATSPVVTSPATAEAAAANAPTTQSGKPELTPEEKKLVSGGYRLEMRKGEKWFCRREDELGSRLGAHKVCGTAAMLSQKATNTQDSIRKPGTFQNMPAH